MRLVLDVTRTPDDRYEGHLTVPGTATRQAFAGILELLEILEQLPLNDLEDLGAAQADTPARQDGTADEGRC